MISHADTREPRAAASASAGSSSHRARRVDKEMADSLLIEPYGGSNATIAALRPRKHHVAYPVSYPVSGPYLPAGQLTHQPARCSALHDGMQIDLVPSGSGAAATAGAVAAGDTLLRMSREGWQVFGRQIADSRTTRAYREEVACCGAATITLPQTSSVCAVRRDGHQIICSTSLHVGRAACQRSLPSSPITEQDIGRAAAKQ